jgi:hypothetical protein
MSKKNLKSNFLLLISNGFSMYFWITRPPSFLTKLLRFFHFFYSGCFSSSSVPSIYWSFFMNISVELLSSTSFLISKFSRYLATSFTSVIPRPWLDTLFFSIQSPWVSDYKNLCKSETISSLYVSGVN